MEDKNLGKTVDVRNVAPTEAAYRDGYIRGQENSEKQQQYIDQIRQESQKNREGDSAASGLITGIILTAIIGAGIAASFFVYQTQNIPTRSSNPKVEKETKVIEKTTDRVREITPASPPNVEINIPSSVEPPNYIQPSPIPQPTGATEQNTQTKNQ